MEYFPIKFFFPKQIANAIIATGKTKTKTLNQKHGVICKKAFTLKLHKIKANRY